MRRGAAGRRRRRDAIYELLGVNQKSRYTSAVFSQASEIVVTALLAIDQGTTSTRAIVFSHDGRKCSQVGRELKQHYPAPGWVEHDAEQIWRDTIFCVREALQAAGVSATDLAGLGITNQRETTVIWDRCTGQPIAPAIVWQDRRTAARCEHLASVERNALLQEKTGLLLDPYFCATKIGWILDQVEGARNRAESGELAFGTIDSWLIWKMTAGARHVTDVTNACRTLLFDIRTQDWDEELLQLFDVPRGLLPEVCDSAADFGSTKRDLFGGSIPIRAVLGDQQAATVGQACFQKGMIKSTYGTGCFIVLNTGNEIVKSSNRLLTTIAYRLDGDTTYALEGSIFTAGAAVQWLRDAMRLIDHAGESEAIARSIDGTDGVYLVPAFTGLGAPYWDPAARGALIGLTRDTGIAHIVRAALEAVCYQTRDLLEAMALDAFPAKRLRVDGGMAVNDWLLQNLSDVLRIPVERPEIVETTAMGVSYFAGLQAGVYQDLDDIGQLWKRDREVSPKMDIAQSEALYAGWKDAVARVRVNHTPF